MSNKNPFELRAEVLGMAKDYMDQAWQMNLEFTRSMFEQGKKTVDDMQTAFTPYDIKDLMSKAQEMYSFVTKKD